jgi:ankyrin repeat protein
MANSCQRLYFAIAMAEPYVLEQSCSSVKLDIGDFLVFDENNSLFVLKKDEFYLHFRHADCRGSYVYNRNDDVQKGKEENEIKFSKVSDISQLGHFVNESVVLPTIDTTCSLVLDQQNASKWIQKATILAFYLKECVSITNQNCNMQYRGDVGDVMVIHLSGSIETIVAAKRFPNYFSFLKSDETEVGITISVDDSFDPTSALLCGASARLVNEHHVEVKRLYPIFAREMKTPFTTLQSCDGIRPRMIPCGQAGEYLVQESRTMQKRVSSMTLMATSIVHALSEQGADILQNDDIDEKSDDQAADNNDIALQWVLSSNQINRQYIRVEEEKEKGDIVNNEEECQVVSNAEEEDTQTERKDYLLMPTDAFLPHYKCWEGIIHKRTKITQQWKANYIVLYPNKLAMGRDFPMNKKKGQLYQLHTTPEEFKTVSQTIHLAYCSIHPSVIDKKQALFLDNVKLNETLEKRKCFEPYSAVKKTAGTKLRRLSSFIAKKALSSSKDEAEMISNANGIYLASTTLGLDVFSTLLNSAILYARRDMVLGATKTGDCDRVVEILLSVSPADALSILQTLCPIDSSPGMLLQHEAAKTSLDLLKVLFPVEEGQSKFFSLFNKDLDIFAFSSSGFMCLHYAVLADNIEIVKYLLENEAFQLSTSTLTRHGKTPLHLAKSRAVTTYLLDHAASRRIEDDYGNSPLMSLITFGGYDAVMTFLEHSSSDGSGKSEVDYDINAKCWKNGFSALSYAIRTLNEKSIEIVQQLLEKGADPNSIDLKNNSCLHEAIYLFNTLSKRFAVDETFMCEDTAVCLELVRMLVQAGADISLENDEEKTPFLLLCHADCFYPSAEAEEIVDLLITVPENFDDGDDMTESRSVLNSRASDGSFPLHHIVRRGNSALLECLIKKGAPVNSKDQNGNTPLDLVHGAQANITASTPLHEVEQMMKCLDILTNNKAFRRLRKNLPMEVSQSTIKFSASSAHVGLYEVKSATLSVIVDRLCSELLYNDVDAEALVFSFKESEKSFCDVTLDLIASNYPEIRNDATLPLHEKDVDIEMIDDDNDNDNDLAAGAGAGAGYGNPPLDSRGTSVTNDSFVSRKSRKGSGFIDAREHSPGGLLLLLRMWFDLNPKSIGKS